ncbi:MAG TPA: PilW family protein [Polyangia bacterium]|nr:PilW family protein [Polyangia bacterium]
MVIGAARATPCRDRRAGLTLVELMVTLVIAGMVTSSAFVFFAGQRRVYDQQMKVLGVQQNLWASMDTLARFVRAAGTGMIGCVNTTDPPPGGATAPATGLRAYTAGPPAALIRLAPIWIQNGANGAPDRITVVFGTGTFGNFSDVALGASVQKASDPVITPNGLTTAFRAGEFAMLLDTSGLPAGPPLADRGCTLFQVTGTNAGTNTLLRATTSSWNPPGDFAGLIPFDYVGGASPKAGVRNFGALNWVQFSIDTTGTSPRLMMARLDGTAGPTTPQVLAEGIEDLQIAYACDLDPAAPAGPDGVLSEGTDGPSRLADEWTYNVAGDAPQVGCVRPQAVRLSIVARTTAADDNLNAVALNAKPAAEDGVAGAKDNFRHRVLTTTVSLRNR